MVDWPGLPYLARLLKDLPGDTPVAVYPWIPADAESSGLVPGYLIAASRIDVTGVAIPGDEEPHTPPPPPPPPPPEPTVETWYVATDKGQTLRLRDGAGLKFKIIGQLARGTELKITGRIVADSITWTQVLEPVQGYTAVDYLSLVSPDPPPPPPIETEIRYATGSGLRVRSAPDAKANNIIGTLNLADAVTVKKSILVNGVNGDTNKWRVRAEPVGYIADQFLSLDRPKVDAPPEPPPSVGLLKFGAHVHLDKNINKVYQFIEAYQPLSVTVISDIPLIRWIVEHKYVKYPIFRHVWGPWDPQPEHVGDESDIERGKRFFYEGYDQQMNLWWWNQQCPHGTILQLNNETNSWKMSYWNIGLMQAADQAGYKVIIDNAGVGQYANAVVNGQLVRPLYFDEQGNPHSDIVPGTNKTLMEHVYIGWRYAQEHGHFVGKHEYGNEEDGQHRWPGSPIGLPFYGLRIHNFLKMMPKPWPNVIINEMGSGKTERQKDAGFESAWNGIKEYLPLINGWPNILCANLWTFGDYAGHLGFPGASVDDWTDQMIARRGELPRA